MCEQMRDVVTLREKETKEMKLWGRAAALVHSRKQKKVRHQLFLSLLLTFPDFCCPPSTFLRCVAAIKFKVRCPSEMHLYFIWISHNIPGLCSHEVTKAQHYAERPGALLLCFQICTYSRFHTTFDLLHNRGYLKAVFTIFDYFKKVKHLTHWKFSRLYIK